MARPEAETTPATRLPTVLVVGCTREIVTRCVTIARAGGAAVREANVVSAATQAARWRALVIVVPAEIYEFDRSGFDDLARDVGAELLPLVGDGTTLDDLLPIALATAARRRSEAPKA